MEMIKCPYCGYEYLPCELYLPNSFLGKTTTIFKDELGKIIAYDRDNGDMDLKDDYRCDGCGRRFNVEAEVSFKTIPMEKSHSDVFTVNLND